jgi:very-short-patch-repair endonuclease
VGAALSSGIGEGRLRSSDLERPFRGVRAIAGSTTGLFARCAAYRQRMLPGQFFSHLTAAQLWGAPLPLEALDAAELHVSVLDPSRAPRAAGIVGHKCRPDRASVVERFQLPLADAATTWCQLAELLSLDDLVAVGDHLVLDPVYGNRRDPRPYVPLGELTERAAHYTGRGARAVRSAISFVRVGAESRPETLVRLALLRAGLPEPELNVNVFDAQGRFIGRADMLYRQWKVIVEYDGEQHRTDDRQYDKDLWRLEAFAAAGWRVVRIRKHGLANGGRASATRVKTALHAAGWRP